MAVPLDPVLLKLLDPLLVKPLDPVTWLGDDTVDTTQLRHSFIVTYYIKEGTCDVAVTQPCVGGCQVGHHIRENLSSDN